jgi:hypothetical protein
MLSSRKENQQMVQPQKVGALVILNYRGKKELLVTKFILLKVNSKVLLEKVLNGLRIDAAELFMDGSSQDDDDDDDDDDALNLKLKLKNQTLIL